MKRIAALLTFTGLTLRLNLRSRQALVYGYAMPLFFLFAFSALFRGGNPPLLAQMGQVLTITILGGACFGLPTGLVAERDQGVWRRYRLLPVSTASLLSGVLLVRLLLVASAAALQLLAAHTLLGTPWPALPGPFVLSYLLVAVAFLGLGLVIAAVAENVPAVQAIGQCLFLPMIILGGVGVSLSALPPWGQMVSAFMPGRFAVALLQSTYEGRFPAGGVAFEVATLAGIGVSAFAVGALLFRSDARHRLGWGRRFAAAIALVPWLVVGVVALRTGEWRPPAFPAPFEALEDKDIRSIRFDDLPGDNEFVTPIGPPLVDEAGGPQVQAIVTRLGTWAPANTGDLERDVRAMLTLAGLADISQDAHERDFARAVYVVMRARYTRNDLRRVLAWVVLHPEGEPVITLAPEVGIRKHSSREGVLGRATLYARKFLGRVEGVIRD